MTIHVPLFIFTTFFFFFFIFLKILSLWPAFYVDATAIALQVVQKQAEKRENCEKPICSLTVHKKGLVFDRRE
jgi:hypothetical protein